MALRYSCSQRIEQAASIEAAVRAAGINDVEVGSFPEEAAGVARETLKLA